MRQVQLVKAPLDDVCHSQRHGEVREHEADVAVHGLIRVCSIRSGLGHTATTSTTTTSTTTSTTITITTTTATTATRAAPAVAAALGCLFLPNRDELVHKLPQLVHQRGARGGQVKKRRDRLDGHVSLDVQELGGVRVAHVQQRYRRGPAWRARRARV